MPYWVYEIGKTVHFIGLVSWFAALFYMPRLFIYHVEAFDKPENESKVLIPQFELMQKRLYHIIMTPAMVITFLGGFTMIFYYGWDWFRINSWMHWKLLFIVLLTGYHHYNKVIMKRLAKGERVMSSAQFRMYNEIATLLLLAIVLLAVFKNNLDFLIALFSILTFAILLMLGIKFYKRYRIRKGQEKEN